MRLRVALPLAAGALLVGLLFFVVFNTRRQWIPAAHVGVIFHSRGGLERKVYKPSRVWVPWMSKLYVYPTSQQVAVYTNDPDESDIKSSDAVRVTTSDNASTNFDIAVWWRVEPDAVLTIFDNYKGQGLDVISNNVLRPAIRQPASDVGSKFDAFSLMGEKRGEASKALTQLLANVLRPRGISVDRAEFMSPDPPENVVRRVMGQVNAETNLRIAELDRQIAEEKKAIAITQAEAKSKASALTAKQSSVKSLELQALEVKIEGLKKWDGTMPRIRLSERQPVYLGPSAQQ